MLALLFYPGDHAGALTVVTHDYLRSPSIASRPAVFRPEIRRLQDAPSGDIEPAPTDCRGGNSQHPSRYDEDEIAPADRVGIAPEEDAWNHFSMKAIEEIARVFNVGPELFR